MNHLALILLSASAVMLASCSDNLPSVEQEQAERLWQPVKNRSDKYKTSELPMYMQDAIHAYQGEESQCLLFVGVQDVASKEISIAVEVFQPEEDWCEWTRHEEAVVLEGATPLVNRGAAFTFPPKMGICFPGEELLAHITLKTESYWSEELRDIDKVVQVLVMEFTDEHYNEIVFPSGHTYWQGEFVARNDTTIFFQENSPYFRLSPCEINLYE